MESARSLAVRLLMRTFEEGGYSHLLLRQTLDASGLSPQDRGLCTMLYQGTAARMLTLRHIVSLYSKRPPEKLDAPVRYILYLGLYQLLYCDRIPDSAAVNESVKLTGQFRVKSASGLVNYVLRQFLRDGRQYPVTADLWQSAVLRYSVPEELLRTVAEERGWEFAEQFFADALLPAPCTVRLNTLRATAEEIADLHPQKCSTEGCFQVETPDITGTEPFRKGLLHVEDEASQLCVQMLAPQPGETVLDVCAAPGGKSFTIAEQMQDEGHVYAFDLHPQRAELIRKGAARLGLQCITADVQDATVRREDMPMADRILCDVPCSGLGVIRRKPEIRYKPLKTFRELPEMQYRIMETASQYLKPGGVLVYSTCTILRTEDEAVVERFLRAHPEFSPEQMRLLPDEKHRCDGFFAARLVKEGQHGTA